MADSNNEFPTTIGADAVFKGQLHFEKGVRLLGRFEGEITSQGQLLVAEGAALTGDVKAGIIRIDGEVKGNLAAETKVQLSASARVEGDVQAQRLEVAEGAVLIGRCAVGINDKGKKGVEVKAASRPALEVPTAKVKPGQAVPVGAKQ